MIHVKKANRQPKLRVFNANVIRTHHLTQYAIFIWSGWELLGSNEQTMNQNPCDSIWIDGNGFDPTSIQDKIN